MGPKKKQEANENNGMQRYYLITFIMFALLSLYCLQFVMAWQNHTCLINDTLELQAAALAKEKDGGRRQLDQNEGFLQSHEHLASQHWIGRSLLTPA